MNWNGGVRARILDKNNRAYFLQGNRPQYPSLNPRFGHGQEPPSTSQIPPCPLLLNTQNLPRGGDIFALQLSLQLGIGQRQRLSAPTPRNTTRSGNRENGLSSNNTTLHRSDSESRASDSVSNNESFVSQSNFDRNINRSDNVMSSSPSPNINDVVQKDTKIPGYTLVSLLSRPSSSEHARHNSISSSNRRGRNHIRMGTPNPSDSETTSSQGQRTSFNKVVKNSVPLSFTSTNADDSVAGGQPNYCNTISEGITSNGQPNSRIRLPSAVVSNKDIVDNRNNSSQNRTRQQSQSQSDHRDVNGNRTAAPNLVNSNKRLTLVDASYGRDDTDYSRTSSDNFPQDGITSLTTLRGRAPPPGQNVFKTPSSIQPQSQQNRSSSSMSNPTSTNPVIRRPMSVPATIEEGHTPNYCRPASTSTSTSTSRSSLMVGPNAGSQEVFRHQRSPKNIVSSSSASQDSDSNNSIPSDKDGPGNQWNNNRGGNTPSLPISTPGRAISRQSTTSSSSSYHTPVGLGDAHNPDQHSPGNAAPRYFCPTIISNELLRSPQDFHNASSSTRSEAARGIGRDARAPSNFPWTSTNSKDLLFENYPENPVHRIQIGNSTSSGLARSAANSTTVSGATAMVTVNTDLALRSLPSASSSTETSAVIATRQAQNDPSLSYASTAKTFDDQIRYNPLRTLLRDVNSSPLPNPHNTAAFLHEPSSLLVAETEDSRKRFGNNIWEGLELDSDFDFHPLSLAEYAPRPNKVQKMNQNNILIGSDYNFEDVDVDMINFDFGESDDYIDDQL